VIPPASLSTLAVMIPGPITARKKRTCLHPPERAGNRPVRV
jgi:hypothetical protein